MKVLSLFSGIGAFEKALTNLGIEFETVGFSEIDRFAVQSYCAIHNQDITKNLGDITKIDLDNLPECELITHGSPCQDFSVAGKGKGGDVGTETRSSLMWNSVEIISRCKPKYVVWENVKNVLSKKHRHNFDKYEQSERNNYLLKRIDEALTNLDSIPKEIMSSQKNTDYYKLLKNLKKIL